MRNVLSILGQLSDADVDWLSRHGRRLRLPRGTVLIQHGTLLEELYVVLDGRLTVQAPNGVHLGEVCAGDILGELAFIEGGRTTATVTAADDVRVLALSADELNRKLVDDLPFSARFHRALALFLASHLVNTMRRAGLDAADRPAPGQLPTGDELGRTVLDHLHLAGARFDRILKQLAG